LYTGLVAYGFSLALMLRADLGLDPWDVFHQGVAERLGWSFGAVVIATGALVLLLWVPLRQRPGLGTISNIVVIGLVVDAALLVLPHVTGIPARVGLLAGGVLLNGAATAAYIGEECVNVHLASAHLFLAIRFRSLIVQLNRVVNLLRCRPFSVRHRLVCGGSHGNRMGGGGFLAVETEKAFDRKQLAPMILEHSVWLRPIGNVMYAVPPFTITPDELRQVIDAMSAAVRANA
jgi:uncharacterized membrane protein YczE